MHTRVEERLVGVNVPHAGKHGLVEQRRLDRPPRSIERTGKLPRRHGERIRPATGQLFLGPRLGRAERPQTAKSTRITKSQHAAAARPINHPHAVNMWIALPRPLTC